MKMMKILIRALFSFNMQKFLIKLKRALCGFRNHPNQRVYSGPFNGYWTIHCPDCDQTWDELYYEGEEQ